MATKINKEKRVRQKKIILRDASLTRRGIAYLLDWYLGALATAFPISIISKVLTGTMLHQDIINFKSPYGLLGGGLGLICAFLYYVIIPKCVWDGQTPGKRICNVKIVTEDNQQLTWKHILLRQIVGMILIEGTLVSASAILHQVGMILTGIDFLTPLKYIGLAVSGISSLFVLFRKNHKAIHDYIGKTRVVNCN